MTEPVRWSTIGAVLLAVSCWACASKSARSKRSDAGATDGGLSAEDYATAVCKLVAPCCAPAHRSANVARCRAALDLSMYDKAAVSALAFSAENARTCIAQLSGMPNLCADPDRAMLSASACGRVYLGAKGERTSDAGFASVEPGGACQSDPDCAPSSAGEVRCISRRSASGFVLLCQVQILGIVGDGPCSATADAFGSSGEPEIAGVDAGAPGAQTIACDHANGAACDFGTHHCVPLAEIGQPCVNDLDCAGAAYCDCTSGSTCARGTATCVARRPNGAQCTLPGAYHQCLPDSYCDPANNTCASQAKTGAPCMTAPQCQSHSCAANICVTAGQQWLDIACNIP